MATARVRNAVTSIGFSLLHGRSTRFDTSVMAYLTTRTNAEKEHRGWPEPATDRRVWVHSGVAGWRGLCCGAIAHGLIVGGGVDVRFGPGADCDLDDELTVGPE